MTSPIDNEWTIITPSTTNTTITAIAMDSQAINPIPAAAPAAAAEPKIEVTINPKLPAAAEKKAPVCTCNETNPPKLARQDSNDSLSSDYDNGYRRPRRRNNFIRRYTPSPPGRNRSPGRERTPMLSSSSQLLAKVSSHDGIVDVPYPARSSVYLTTYPFTNQDVKKWAWLIGYGVEETYLEEKSRGRGRYDDDEDERPTVGPARRRNHSPIYDASLVDVPSVYLSRALDTAVVPEDTEHNVKYLIVVQHRPRPEGAKLMVADSRKAAGIMMYYEVLTGRSILFVGAMVHQCKKVAKDKICKVDNLEEALKVQEEGGVGIIC